MTSPLPSQIQCPRCGAFAFPTDQAVRASQSNASWSTVAFKCEGVGCHRLINYSPITGRVDAR